MKRFRPQNRDLSSKGKWENDGFLKIFCILNILKTQHLKLMHISYIYIKLHGTIGHFGKLENKYLCTVNFVNLRVNGLNKKRNKVVGIKYIQNVQTVGIKNNNC